MPVISESLSVWDIAHRWAGYDPSVFRLKLPMLVKDYARILFNEILEGHLFCGTLIQAKRPSVSNADASYYIRSHLDDVYMCVWGKRYKKKLLKWATISRYDFEEWCGRYSVPLPEFWFPTGWNRDFDWPELGPRALWAYHIEPDEPGGVAYGFDLLSADNEDAEEKPATGEDIHNLRHNQLTKLIVHQMAPLFWKEFPERTISDMARDEILLKYSGAANYGESAIIKWLSEVAPPNIKGKRGRPKKKPDTGTD